MFLLTVFKIGFKETIELLQDLIYGLLCKIILYFHYITLEADFQLSPT